MEPFSFCRSGLTTVVLENADSLHEPRGLVWATAQLPQDLPHFELGETASADQCVLAGFPDVSLVGTAHHPDRGTTTEQYRWPLQHVVRDAPAVPVPPSGEVRVPITYLAAREGSASMTTTSIELQLPGAATPIVIPWASDISLQDAATRPGTYSGGFENTR